jgi:hypothetical protein
MIRGTGYGVLSFELTAPELRGGRCKPASNQGSSVSDLHAIRNKILYSIPLERRTLCSGRTMGRVVNVGHQWPKMVRGLVCTSDPQG